LEIDNLPVGIEPPYISSLASSQLDSPIGVGTNRGSSLGNAISGRLLMNAIRLYLRHGMLYYNEKDHVVAGDGRYGPMNHMFPITPVELFKGGVIGFERVITSVSGTFRWPNVNVPELVVFDRDGNPTNGELTARKVTDGWELTVLINDWSYIAVIEPAD